MSEIPMPHVPPAVKGLGSHYKVIAFGLIAVVVVFVLMKARKGNTAAVATPIANPIFSGGVGPGTTQSPVDNAGTSPVTDANSAAIQALSATQDLQFTQAQRLQGLSIAGTNAAETTREQGVSFNETTRQAGSTFDTANALTTGLNGVKVLAATDAETMAAQAAQFDWLYGKTNTVPDAGGFLRSYSIQGTPPTVGNGGTRADTLFRYSQAPIAAQFQRDQNAADATATRQIKTADAATQNQIQGATNAAQNEIAVSKVNTSNTILINNANVQGQLATIKQQGDTTSHVENVKSRNAVTGSIVGTVGKLLGGLFHF